MPAPEQAIADLHDRLRRYPPDRFPVQHATACFHLGALLSHAGRLAEAEEALRTAARLFGDHLSVEGAKALNALGAVLRAAARPGEAADAFRRALAAFRTAELPLEEGAATFNLGLVLREAGDLGAALDAFADARRLFPPATATPQAAAAVREAGAALVVLGRHDEAVPVLQEAVELARRSADWQAVGAASNALGLAHLGAGDAADAADAFRASASANPRSVRPDGYAMAKANLALALERAGDDARARLAAAQAAVLPAASPAVRAQARESLARLGEPTGELARVLAEDPMERRAATVRDELARWLDLGDDASRVEATAWVSGVAAAPRHAEDLCETWLAGLLELPTDAMERLIRLALAGWADADGAARHAFRAAVSRAMGLFHAPQWMRLKDTFNRLAAEAGQEPVWG